MNWPDDFINKIICGDCFDILDTIPDNSIELCFVDPPFNAKKGIGLYKKKYDVVSDDLTEVAYQEFCEKLFNECRRISRKLLITPGVVNIARYPLPLWTIPILKPSCCSFSKLRGYNCWEPLLVYDQAVKPIPRDVVTYDSRNFNNDGRSKHPCPDNQQMLHWIVDSWSREGELVIDPMAGSGTTLVAAKQLSRRYIGIEISEDYCDMARQLLAQEELFNKAVVNYD